MIPFWMIGMSTCTSLPYALSKCIFQPLYILIRWNSGGCNICMSTYCVAMFSVEKHQLCKETISEAISKLHFHCFQRYFALLGRSTFNGGWKICRRESPV